MMELINQQGNGKSEERNGLLGVVVSFPFPTFFLERKNPSLIRKRAWFFLWKFSHFPLRCDSTIIRCLHRRATLNSAYNILECQKHQGTFHKQHSLIFPKALFSYFRETRGELQAKTISLFLHWSSFRGISIHYDHIYHLQNINHSLKKEGEGFFWEYRQIAKREKEIRVCVWYRYTYGWGNGKGRKGNFSKKGGLFWGEITFFGDGGVHWCVSWRSLDDLMGIMWILEKRKGD